MVVGFYGQGDRFGEFSNFYASNFMVGQVEYTSAEQYIMFQKAMLFDDTSAARQILSATNPAECKRLGRSVDSFDDRVWRIHRWELCLPGIYSKFVQNLGLEKVLLSTGDNIIAECSPTDRIWGIGLRTDDFRVQDPLRWKGYNLLGKLLMCARSAIIADVAPNLEVAGITLCTP